MKNFFVNIFSSCLGTLLALLILVFILAMVATSQLATEGAAPVKTQTILKLDFNSAIPEQSNNLPLEDFSLNTEMVIGLRDMVKTIQKAKTDDRIKGIYFNVSPIDEGFATLKEIRDVLLDFKSSGKFIYCYSYYLNHKNYYLSSVADEIHFHPLGFTELKGLGYSLPHFKELSDKLGISFNIYYAGEFKSATEPFRMNKMSDYNRLQLRAFLDDIYASYLNEVAASRKLDRNVLKNNFDNFLSHTPQLALENGLVDHLSTETEVFNIMRGKLGIDDKSKLNFISQSDYYKNTKDTDENYSSSNRIAIVFAEGDIIDSNGEEGQIGRKYLKTLREISELSSIKAVVLRVNSPGGSALLSDEFLEEMKLIKSKGKPVVVSMGDYAASGGYYISCFADSIFSNPFTLTGSIGVFALIPNFAKLTDEKLGIDYDSVGTGPYANKFNLMFPWGEEEKQVLEKNILATYNRFTDNVANGRNIPIEDVKEIARGRIYSGHQALKLNLVNSIGSLNDAIECAARLASIDSYRTSEFPTQKDPIQKLVDALQGKESGSTLQSAALKNELGKTVAGFDDLIYWQKAQGLQMRLPYVLK